RPASVMRIVSRAPPSSAGIASAMTDQSNSMPILLLQGCAPEFRRARARSAPRLGAEPLLVDFVVAAVLLHVGERRIDLGNQLAALGKADAVLMRHHLLPDSLNLAAACRRHIVEHVRRIMHGSVDTASLQLEIGVVDVGELPQLGFLEMLLCI